MTSRRRFLQAAGIAGGALAASAVSRVALAGLPEAVVQSLSSGLKRAQPSLRTREEPLIQAKSKQDSFAGFALGQNVRHEKFGVGVVIDATHKGEHANLKINFGKNGVKELNTQFAKLESM